MPTRKVTQVRKRDGRVVDYDEKRVAEAIYRAALAAGLDNRYLADDLAGVVTLYLERYYEGELPDSSEIQKMVAKILVETGHAEIARAYESYGTQPEKPEEELFPETRLLVDGLTHDEVSSWGRHRISSALIKESGLPEDVANEIAQVVEQKIIELGQRRISSSLIRDLVNHELIQRGHGSRVPRQLVVGVPKYDLARLLEPGAPDTDTLARTIGETTLKQYALQEIFSQDVANAHLEGRIHVHHLEQPLKLAWYGVAPSDLPAVVGLPADSPRTLTARIALAHRTLQRRSVQAEVLGLNTQYGPLISSGGAEEAAHLLLALDGWVPGLDLTREDPFALDLLQAMKGGHQERVAIVGTGEAFRETIRQAADGAPTLFLLDRPPATRRSRFGKSAAIAQVVSINLPQSYFRDDVDFYSQLDRSLELAVRAHVEKRRLRERLGADPEETRYAIAVVGLEDLVRVLCGNSPGTDESALKLALRIMSYLNFRVQEESKRHRLDLALEDVDNREAADRFFRVDEQMYARARGLTIKEYAVGFHLHGGDMATRLTVESRFHTLVPSGRACLPSQGLSASDLELLLDRAQRTSMATQIFVS